MFSGGWREGQGNTCPGPFSAGLFVAFIGSVEGKRLQFYPRHGLPWFRCSSFLVRARVYVLDNTEKPAFLKQTVHFLGGFNKV